jgi:hypothetical protein
MRMRTSQSLLLVFWLAGALDGMSQKAINALPLFKDYPVDAVFHGDPAAPVLNTDFANLFHTRLREAAARGPNFAGRYTLAEWGCGSACIQIALIDDESGTVYEGPFDTLIYDVPANYADGANPHVVGFQPLVYRLNSRLLVVHGCPEQGTDCRVYYYEWVHGQFRLLKSIRARPHWPETDYTRGAVHK